MSYRSLLGAWMRLVMMTCCLSTTAAQPPGRVAQVEVGTIEQTTVTPSSRFVATVVPTRRSLVGAAVGGRVETFLLNPDDEGRKLTRVARDQVLAQLKTDTISRELGVAQAELQLREQELAELRNGSRPEEIAVAQAQLERATARLTYADARYNRLQKLFDNNNTVSLDQLEEAKSFVDQAEQSQLEAAAAYKLIAAGPRREDIAQAEARVVGQRETVERLEGIVRKYTVRSPFDGYVVAEFTEIGAWVSEGDPVAEVIQLRPIEVEASLPEKYIPSIRVGDPATVLLEALPAKEFPGVIHRLIPQADVKSRTFPIRVRFDESIDPEQARIMAGMLGHVDLQLQDAQSVMLVPKDAIVLGGRQPQVIVIDPVTNAVPNPAESGAAAFNGVARSVTVNLGIARGNRIEIRGDVQPGQQVVTRGNERLRDQQKVLWKRQTTD